MLNLALRAPSQKLLETLMDEKDFLPSIMELLKSQSSIVRGKAVITFLMLFKIDFRWMAYA